MRYGIAILVIAFLAIVGSVVLIGRGQSGSSNVKARVTKIASYDADDSASISWTQQGRLVGDDQRQAIRVTITRSQRTVELLDQYTQRVERSESFANTPEAFSAFIRALDLANFGRERTVKQADERGVCPLGNRFIYRLTNSKDGEVMRTWSDTCGTTDGPFGGGNTAQLISQLFKAQITGYNKFVSGVQL